MSKKLMVIMGLVLLSGLLLCGPSCTDNKKSVAEAQPAIDAQTTGASWKNIPSDTKLVGVDAVAKDPKAHAGKVAIEGVVAKVFAERGAFNLIDVAEFASCGQTACAEYTVPILVPKDEFNGVPPKEKDTVLVLGEVFPLESGYRLVVQEVRQKESSPILTRTKSAVAQAAKKIDISDLLPATLLANSTVLGLTEEQETKLTKIQTVYAESRDRIQGKLTHCQGELVELLEKEPLDQAKVDHEKKEIEELKCRLAKEQQKAGQEAHAVLTPQQAGLVPEPKAEAPCLLEPMKG